MPYSSKADVQIEVGGSENLIQLADLESEFPVTTGIDAIVANAIAEADGAINSYIRQRFAIPLAVVTDQIRRLSARWAARTLRRYRWKGQPLTDDIEAEKVDREWLKGVGSGIIQIDIEPTPQGSDLIIDKAAERDTARTVSLRKLEGFI